MKQILIKFLIGSFLAYFGYYLSGKGGEYVTPETIKEYEEDCANSIKTIANLDGSYTEKTVTIMKVPVKMYYYNYQFKVGDNTYKGNFQIDKEPTVLGDSFFLRDIDVWYNKDEPNKNQRHSPCDSMEAMKKCKVSSYSNWFFYFGLPFILIGIILAYRSIKDFFRQLFNGNRQ
jgi:hypothetical protein